MFKLHLNNWENVKLDGSFETLSEIVVDGHLRSVDFLIIVFVKSNMITCKNTNFSYQKILILNLME